MAPRGRFWLLLWLGFVLGVLAWVNARQAASVMLALEVVEIEADRRVRDARQRKLVEVRIRIDGLDALHGRRVVREVTAGAETDLENAAVRGRERALARLVQHPARRREVEHAREDVVVVEAQEEEVRG